MADGFLQVKRPNQQYQSTEGECYKGKTTRQTENCGYQTLLTYLKEVEERDRTDGVAKVWCMLEEKHASQTGVDDVRMTV